MAVFWELHSDLPREGPGDDMATRHVLSLLPKRRYDRILDVGCGPGMQTICLARSFDGQIVAVDTHQPFLDVLAHRTKVERFGPRVKIENASMEALPFPDATFDLIWSEGAIYCIGFERGLKLWRRLLTLDGVVVVSELTWLRVNAPADALRFWERNYPDMSDIAGNLKRVVNSGYNPLATFLLPSDAWFRNYYDPLERRIDALSQKYRTDEAIITELDAQREEIELFRKFNDSYGYVFYAMQRCE